MILYIAFISILNIALGFGLFHYLRRAQVSSSQDQLSGNDTTQSFGPAAEQTSFNDSEDLLTEQDLSGQPDRRQEPTTSETKTRETPVMPANPTTALADEQTGATQNEPSTDTPAEPAPMTEDWVASGPAEQQDAAETASLSAEMTTDEAVEPDAADIEGSLEQGLRDFQDQLNSQTEHSMLHAVETDPGYPATREVAGVAPNAPIEQQDGPASAEADVLAGVEAFRNQLADEQDRASQDSDSETASSRRPR